MIDHEEHNEVSRINLYFASFIAFVGSFGLGNIFSWTSPSLPKLEAADSWLFVDSGTQASWVGSLVSLGAACGPLLSALLLDRVGRRPTIVLSFLIGIVAWIILYPTQQLWTVYLSRLVGGVGGGMMFVAVPVYVAEISEKEVRSALTSLFNFSFTAGLILEFVVGPYVSFGVLILASCAAPLLFFVLSSWLPESPYFLLRRGQEREALVSLSWLRPGASNQRLLEEIQAVKECIAEASASKGGLLELVRRPGLRRAMVAAIGSVVFQQLSGINVVLFYAQNIFQLAGETGLGTSEATIVVGVILLAAAGVGVPLIHRFGFRCMMAVSAAGMTVFLAVLGVYLFLQTHGYDTASYNWLPIACLVCYVIVYSSGFGPGPWVVVAEVFPPDVKGAGSALAVSSCWFTNFLLTWLFPVVVEYWGLYVVFWAFTVFCVLAIIFVLTLIPETRGLSLQEIQDLLNGTASHGIDDSTGWSTLQKVYNTNNESTLQRVDILTRESSPKMEDITNKRSTPEKGAITKDESTLERIDTTAKKYPIKSVAICTVESTPKREDSTGEGSTPQMGNVTEDKFTLQRVDITDSESKLPRVVVTEEESTLQRFDVADGLSIPRIAEGDTLERVDITKGEPTFQRADGIDVTGDDSKLRRVTIEGSTSQNEQITDDESKLQRVKTTEEEAATHNLTILSKNLLSRLLVVSKPFKKQTS